ncbi:hypothetical protein MKW98_006400 [Papaver atlanticum]|uniref:Pentatricopeptide repeat-containing protein n=1 Tax=Papaver atlanticum TaxID=357466 RepID=A0AAD4X344_9MAGN|nr:hypothetical protein MKW98_006400 [Papaver atlanticum]
MISNIQKEVNEFGNADGKNFTFGTVLKSCLEVGSLVIAMQLHGLIVKILDEQGTENVFTWNFMMDSYARNLMINKALVILHSMEEKDTLSWGIMISGIAECGRGIKVLDFFLRLCSLQGPGTYPNSSTFTIAPTVCGAYSMLNYMHVYLSVGSLRIHWRVRDYFMTCSEVISWNSLILGLGQNGHSKKAIEIGEKALRLADEGIEYFGAMSRNSGVEPFLDHYVCVIDILGRAGKVAEAHNFLREMLISLNAVAWATLLNACLVHGNKEIGEVAALELRILEPGNSAGYVMLGNL